METPYILIDTEIVEKNIRKMADIAKMLQVKLRPHAKTHKIPSFALQQLKEGASGITVAKIGEAELMAENGIHNIFMAYPLVGPEKINRALNLAKKISFTVGTDCLEGAKKIAEQAEQLNMQMAVMLEIDTGLRRSGASISDAVHIAREITKMPHLSLKGIFTYKGAFYQGKPSLDFQAAGREEGEMMAALAEELRRQGIPIDDVSVGSTPTAPYAGAVKGVTEIRPGTYIFHDQMQRKLGVCVPEECAARVVVTVVSISSSTDMIVIDGGSKTFATDVQPNQAPMNLSGFGSVVGYPEAVLERMNEEHGMVRMNGPHTLQIGDILHIIPNHICSTINLHNQVYLTDGIQIERYSVMARGLVQ